MAYQYKREPLTVDNACNSHEEKLVIWTLLDTGLRVSELASLARDRVDWPSRKKCGRPGQLSPPVNIKRAGDMVTVKVSPSKRLPNLGYFRTATLPDGTVLKDCGFAAFREGIAKGKTGCEES